MGKLPDLGVRCHKICLICEGIEEDLYVKRLLQLNVWNSIYEIHPIDAAGAGNLFARYQDVYSNGNYELVLVFCDTDRFPYSGYNQLRQKINKFHGGRRTAAEKVIIFANPCTMQIVLSHFEDHVNLTTQSKTHNAPLIERLTGVKDYAAHQKQVESICGKIFQRTYEPMKQRISSISTSDNIVPSTNFLMFLSHFESDNPKWISEINRFLEKS